jgi:hypothetical protein
MTLRLALFALLLGTACASLPKAESAYHYPPAKSQEGLVVVKFTAPARDGIKVGKELDVKGTADVASGDHLWVLVHRIKGFKNLWWPQGEGEIDPVTREWEVHVTFGGPQDIGQDFEIAAVTVDKEAHLKLQKYLEDAMTSGQWLPIKMPPLTSAPQYRRVTKENHN